MNPYAYFLWLWLAFHQPHYYQPPPQPAYQLQYQQMLQNYTPAPIIVWHQEYQAPTPRTITMPECRQLSPTLSVCP